MKQMKKIENKKENKKNESKKIKNVTIDEGNEVTRLFKIILILILIFAVFVGITYFVTRPKDSDTEQETEIQYQEILVGEIWNKGGEYYVLLGHEDDQYLSLYTTYLDLYGQENEDSIYYVTNLDSVFNKKYVAEESNLYTENPSEIRFKGATLLKIKDGKVVEGYEGYDDIMTYLKELVK